MNEVWQPRKLIIGNKNILSDDVAKSVVDG